VISPKPTSNPILVRSRADRLAFGADTFDLIEIGEVYSADRDVE
jgi:hypothetical protein